jgi:hypothetical protein
MQTLNYTVYVVVTNDAAELVSLHALGPNDSYQSATGAHGRIAKETESREEAEELYDRYIRDGYRRDGGIYPA